MTDTIDVHDLPEEQVNLIQEFVDFLRRRFKTRKFIKEEEGKEKEWAKLAITSFAKDWENEKDAIYNNWREHYHVPALLRIFLGLSLLIFLYPQPGFTQSSEELKALRKEVEALKEGQRAIQKELQEIRNILQGKQPPQEIVLNVADDPFKGNKKAKLTLIEFSDYQCPFCARHLRETLPQIELDYIKTGKVKYIFRDFPLESIHREAFKAAEAANCAGDQGKYWEMHARLFGHQKALSLKDLSLQAQALKLDLPKFQQCLDSGKHASEIRNDISEGQRAGVTGTPLFFLGLTGPNHSKVKVLRVIRGAQPYASFKEAIDSLLNAQK